MSTLPNTISDIASAVQESLTPELLHPKYKDNPLAHCYVASEAAYHMLGGRDAGWTPMNLRLPDGRQHWWLRHPEHGDLDLTHGQFEEPIDYTLGRGRGFMTRAPSGRAQKVIDRVVDTLDPEGMPARTASWDDVMQKAKRLILNGLVGLHRNGKNNIVATVNGDHGTYQVEIGRDDPTSRVITTWTCECPWDQFAWDRTRQWKRYEGRVCSHALATFWKSLATPLDDEPIDQDNPPGGEVQKKLEQGPTPNLPTQPEMPFEQRQFNPDGSPVDTDPGQEQDPTQVQMNQGDRIDFGLNQLQQQQPDMFDFMSPTEKKLRQDYPGLFGFSHTAAGDDFDTITEMLRPSIPGKNRVEPTVQIVNQDGVSGELRGGKIPVPGAEPLGVHAEGYPLYHWKDLGFDPSTGMQSDPRRDGPEERGRYGQIPMGARATAIDVNPNERLVCILYYTDGYKLHHHLIKTWVSANDVRIVRGKPPAPYRQRRR